MKLKHFLIASLSLLAACTDSTKETPNGMKFKVVKEGNGGQAKPGEIIVFNFSLTDSKDSVWNQTYSGGFPAYIQISDSASIPTEDGMMQMLRMVSAGDSVVVNFTVKDFFKKLVKISVPPGIDSTRDLTYRIKIDTIMDRNSFMIYQTQLMQKQQADQLNKDLAAIEKYLSDNNITAQKMESGISYIITQPGSGENAQSGQTVKVNYSGYLLDGTYFDSSVKEVAQAKGLPDSGQYEPLEVTVDQSSVIQGWHQALKVMNKGCKGTFYIPSSLAFGPQRRSAAIKENSIVIFDMEVVEIK